MEVAKIVDGNNVLYKGMKMSFHKYGCLITVQSAIQIHAYMKVVGGSDCTLSELREKRCQNLE